MLLTSAIFLVLGILLGFWINARQLAFSVIAVALVVFLGVIGTGDDILRGVVLAAVASAALQLGYVVALLIQAALNAPDSRACRRCARRGQDEDG